MELHRPLEVEARGELEELAEHTHKQIDNDATFTNWDHWGAEDCSPSR